MDNEDETVVDKILEQFDLLAYKDRHPLSLSGGQKQRVAIASAIVSNREIIDSVKICGRISIGCGQCKNNL